jgi:hypothetical protein
LQSPKICGQLRYRFVFDCVDPERDGGLDIRNAIVNEESLVRLHAQSLQALKKYCGIRLDETYFRGKDQVIKQLQPF